MALTKEQKKKIIADLKDKFEKQKIVIFADFTGLRVKHLSNLRKSLKKEGSEIKVAKKTLFGLVLENAGTGVDFKKMKGEIAAIFGYQSETSAAKSVYQFTLTNPNLKITGGIFEKNFAGPEKIIELAKLPSKEELLGRLLGSISAPISNFVYVLEANIKGLLFALSAIKK